MNPTDPNNPNTPTPLPDHNTIAAGTPPPLEPTMPPPPPPMPDPTPMAPMPDPTPNMPPPPVQPGATDLSSVFTPPPLNSSPMPDTNPYVATTIPNAMPDPMTSPPGFSGLPSTSDPAAAPPATFMPPEPPLSSVPPTSVPNPSIGMTTPPPTEPNPSTGFNWSSPSSTPMSPPIAESPANTPGLTDLYGASQPSPVQAEPAPTDLSHLINTGSSTDSAIYTPPLSQPETVVTAPGSGGTEIPNIPTENAHSGIPKWVIGVGVALLLIVIGTSAYFILGIGKSPEPAGIPATGETNNVAPAINALPPAEVTPAPIIEASPSSPLTTVSPTPSTAGTSAIEKLKQQQKAQQSPSP